MTATEELKTELPRPYRATCPRCTSPLDIPFAEGPQSVDCPVCDHAFASTPPIRSQRRVTAPLRLPEWWPWALAVVLWFAPWIVAATRMDKGEWFMPLAWGAILLVAIVVYFVPTIVACICRRRQLVAILVLNVMLGWTFLGWVGALVWACMKIEEVRVVP